MWLDLLMTVPQSWWRCSILCSSACSRRRPACIPLTLWDAGMNGTQAHLRPTASAAPVAKSCLRNANCIICFVQHADPAGWGNVCSTAKHSGGCSASQKPRVSSRAWEYLSKGLALEQSRLFYLQTEKSEISSKKLLIFYSCIFLHQGVDMDKDWKLIPLFIQMDQLCACDPQQVTKQNEITVWRISRLKNAKSRIIIPRFAFL